MAAHGFITQHRWRHRIRALINMDSCGAGGREVAIQTGPKNSWLAQLYAAEAPYPHGHVLGQNIFQSGVVPGDTDFQVEPPILTSRLSNPRRERSGMSEEDVRTPPACCIRQPSAMHRWSRLLGRGHGRMEDGDAAEAKTQTAFSSDR